MGEVAPAIAREPVVVDAGAFAAEGFFGFMETVGTQGGVFDKGFAVIGGVIEPEGVIGEEKTAAVPAISFGVEGNSFEEGYAGDGGPVPAEGDSQRAFMAK